jgi:hypothetical protein
MNGVHQTRDHGGGWMSHPMLQVQYPGALKWQPRFDGQSVSSRHVSQRVGQKYCVPPHHTAISFGEQ